MAAISIGRTQHRAEIVAEDLDRQILAHPGDQLVETHLDWLREADLVARQFRCFGIQFAGSNHPWTGPDRATRSRGFKMMYVSDAFGGIGSAARSGVPVREKTKATCGNRPAIVSLASCMACDCESDVLGIRLTSMTMFFSSRVGVNSCPRRRNNSDAPDEQKDRTGNHRHRRANGSGQCRLIEGLQAADEEIFLLLHAAGHSDRDHCRHEGEREHERGRERDDHGHRHRHRTSCLRRR